MELRKLAFLSAWSAQEMEKPSVHGIVHGLRLNKSVRSHSTFMSTNVPVHGKTLGKYSAKVSISNDGFFTIAQEPPGSGKIVLHFSSAKGFADSVLLAGQQAEAAHKLQAK